jgi:hypothetical protein
VCSVMFIVFSVRFVPLSIWVVHEGFNCFTVYIFLHAFIYYKR